MVLNAWLEAEGCEKHLNITNDRLNALEVHSFVLLENAKFFPTIITKSALHTQPSHSLHNKYFSSWLNCLICRDYNVKHLPIYPRDLPISK